MASAVEHPDIRFVVYPVHMDGTRTGAEPRLRHYPNCGHFEWGDGVWLGTPQPATLDQMLNLKACKTCIASGVVSKDELKRWLEDRYPVEFIDKPDAVRGLSSHLVRGRPGNRLTLAVGGDARPETAINALLDLLAWQWQMTVELEKPGDAADLLVGDGPNASRILDAWRTLVATHAGRPRIHLHLVAKDGTTLRSQDAHGPAPAFTSSGRPAIWAGYLSRWWDAQPDGLAADLADAIGDRRARLYPSLSDDPAVGEWSLRIDGLQVGAVGSASGHLGIGKTDTGSGGVAAAAWKKIAGTGQKVVSASPRDGELDVAAAAGLVRTLITEFDGAAGGRLEHGQPEHALEATVLRGELKVMVGGRALEPLLAPSDPPTNSRVTRGSQIPTQWWPGGAPRYLDALLRDEQTAWAVEMKEPSRAGGYGPYLRHAIGQAVLYRHFLRMASPYAHWFDSVGLDQRGVRALVLYPQPEEAVEARISRRIGDLWLLASAFDVQLAAVSVPPAARRLS